MTPSTGLSDPAQQIVSALASVAKRLTTAAGPADGLAASLRRRETDLAQIRVQARKGANADEARPCSSTAFELAAVTKLGLQNSADVGDRLLASLDLTRRDLHLARGAISESTSLATSAGVSSPDLDALRQRVGHLDRIIQSTTDGAARATTHLFGAAQAFGELAPRPRSVVGEDRQELLQVEAVVDDGESHLTRAKSTLGLVRAFLEDGRIAASQGTEAARRLSPEEVPPARPRHAGLANSLARGASHVASPIGGIPLVVGGSEPR